MTGDGKIDHEWRTAIESADRLAHDAALCKQYQLERKYREIALAILNGEMEPLPEWRLMALVGADGDVELMPTATETRLEFFSRMRNERGLTWEGVARLGGITRERARTLVVRHDLKTSPTYKGVDVAE